uniref:Uncharacterized protein n=1 Tax=Timema poppense TaxID=170557 RepID=A0A7R9DK38_TIMPO|nr:unnamed protein product [Timema poppensis]
MLTFTSGLLVVINTSPISVRYVMLHMTLLVLERNVPTQAIFLNMSMTSLSIPGSALTEYDDMRFFPILFESQLPVMELPKSPNSSELIEDSTIFELNLENEEEQVLNQGSEKSNLQVLTVNAMNVTQDARHLNVSPHGNYTFEFSSVGKNDGLLKMRFNANIDEEYELGAIKKNDETHDHERKDDKTHMIDVGGISESLEHNPTPVDNGDFQGSSSSRVVYTMVVPREELAGASIDVMPSKHLVTIRAQRNNSVCTPASCQLERGQDGHLAKLGDTLVYEQQLHLSDVFYLHVSKQRETVRQPHIVLPVQNRENSPTEASV